MRGEREHDEVRPERRRESAAPADRTSAPSSAPALGNAALQRLLGGIRRSASEDAVVDEPVVREIQAKRGGGRPLDPAARTHFEAALNEDFSDVRVHTGPDADSLSRSLEAEAFTTGSDVFFRSGTYEPLGGAGRKLLAHELTHVVQQRGAPPAGELRVTDPGDASEREAEAVAEEVARFPTAEASARQAADEEETSAGDETSVRRASVQKASIQRNNDYGMYGLSELFGLGGWQPRGPVNNNPGRDDFERLRAGGKIRADDLLQLIPQNLENRFDIEPRTQRGFKFEWGDWHVHGHEPDVGAAAGYAGATSWVVRIQYKPNREWLLAEPWEPEVRGKPSGTTVNWAKGRAARALELSHIPLIV